MMYKERTRNWFLTINETATCFKDVQDILNDTKCEYAYIFHEKDEDIDNLHIHLVIEYENARTFEQVRKAFEGAHIEKAIHLASCYQYLIHKNDTSKRQYAVTDIISNHSCDLEDILESSDEIKLTLEDLENRIACGEIYNFLTACRVYGLKQCNKYRALIKDVLADCILTNSDMNKIADRYERRVDSIKLEYDEVIDNLKAEIDTLRAQLKERGMF